MFPERVPPGAEGKRLGRQGAEPKRGGVPFGRAAGELAVPSWDQGTAQVVGAAGPRQPHTFPEKKEILKQFLTLFEIMSD